MSRWKILNSKNLFKAGFFSLRVDECELPDKRVMPRYYVMEFPDWVNVVPITKDGKIVMVEQYRHGADVNCLEIPGGSTNPGGEDAQAAGARELLEETGFSSSNWISCGFHYPNPALQSNRMHTFVALECEKVSEPNLDPFEDLRSVLMDPREVVQRLERGEIHHSLIAASLSLSLKTLREHRVI